jgi:hypothetical protein
MRLGRSQDLRTRLVGCGVAAAWLVALTGCASSREGGFLENLFSSSGADDSAQTTTEAEPPDVNCPPIEIPPGTAAYQVYDRGGQGDPNSLAYQARFSRFARQCTAAPGSQVDIRAGVAGRLVIGPKGNAGRTIEVPVNLTLTDDGEKQLVSRTVKVRVDVPAGAGGADFQHVEDLGAFPIPPRKMAGWHLRIGFDVEKAKPERRRPAPHVVRRRAPRTPVASSGPNLPSIGRAAPRAPATASGPNLPPLRGSAGPNLPPINTGGGTPAPAPAQSSGPELPPIKID